MTNVTNLLTNRVAAVRDGEDKLIKIQPGQTVDVVGFNAKDEFHAGLIARGDIKLGGAATKAEREAVKGDELMAAVTNAQRDVQEAESAFVAAKEADEGEGSSQQTKATRAQANARVKSARAALDKANLAFEKG